jgi:hypothetical protein
MNDTQQIRVCSSYFSVGEKKRLGEAHRRKNPTCGKKTKKTVQLLIEYHQWAGEKKTLKNTSEVTARFGRYFECVPIRSNFPLLGSNDVRNSVCVTRPLPMSFNPPSLPNYLMAFKYKLYI